MIVLLDLVERSSLRRIKRQTEPLPNELSLLKTFACLIVDIELLQVITSHFVSAKVVIWKAFHILIRACIILEGRFAYILNSLWSVSTGNRLPFELKVVSTSNCKSFHSLAKVVSLPHALHEVPSTTSRGCFTIVLCCYVKYVNACHSRHVS